MVGVFVDIFDLRVRLGVGSEAAISKIEGNIKEVYYYQIGICSKGTFNNYVINFEGLLDPPSSPYNPT